jgi:predicted RNA-binding protein with PUA-like domain
MAAYLLKTEPTSYSFSDLVRDKTTVWDGVKNPAALKHMRAIAKGDTIVIYHTGGEKQAVGLATAASDPYPDPALDDPKRTVFRIKAGKKLKTPVPLSVFKSDTVLRTVEMVRLPRLSVVPLTAAHMKRLLQKADG